MASEDRSVSKRTVKQQVDDRTVWQDVRAILEGEGEGVCQRFINLRYPGASERGTLQVFAYDVLPFILEVAATAFALRPEVTLVGSDNEDETKRPKGTAETAKAMKTLRSWRATFEQAWRMRFSTDLTILHLRWTGDKVKPYELEVLCGDEVVVTPDRFFPRDWQRAKKVVVKQDEGDLVYERIPDGEENGGQYRINYTPTEKLEGDTESLGTIPALPLFAWYRRPSRKILPPANASLRNLHVAAALQMSTIEFQRIFRLNQPYIKTDLKKDKELPTGQDLIWFLSLDATPGVLQTTDNSAQGLDYVVKSVKLGLLLAGVPPSVFGLGGSDAETGIAKAWDQADRTGMLEKDRAAADEAVAMLIEAWLPILGEGWGQIQWACTAPADPVPADRAQYAAGIKAEMALGLTTPAIELGKRRKVGLKKAQGWVDKNLEINAKFLIDPQAVGNGQG